MGIAPVITNVTVTNNTVSLFSVKTYAPAVYFEALSSNSGTIFLGTAGVTTASYMRAMTASQGFSMNSQNNAKPGTDGGQLELSQLRIVASVTASQVLLVSYLPALGAY